MYVCERLPPFHVLMYSNSWLNSPKSIVPLPFASNMSKQGRTQFMHSGEGWGAPPTLGQFCLFDESGTIPVDAFEHPLPVVDVVEEGAELLQVDAPGSVRVEKLCTSFMSIQ
jgi:hypothetical protein